MIHHFKSDISDIPLPDRFTYPFRYVPHPLVVLAAKEVGDYVETRADWSDELRSGKMFGVLIVALNNGGVGYLAAFSGNLAGSNVHEFFVPPVYDLLQPDGFFKVEERNISEINYRINEIEESEDYLSRKKEVEGIKDYANETLKKAKEELRRKKAERAVERACTRPAPTVDVNAGGDKPAAPTVVGRPQGSPLQESAFSFQLIHESQFQKAEYKRLERRLKEEIAAKEALLKEREEEIINLKKERKSRSAALQTRMFRQFRILNARGERKDLVEIFKDTPQGAPPAGAGECALPKMLQYAYLNDLRPLAFGEFWWGDSPKNEVRRHGAFYPSCQGKCAPILRHALIGLEVDVNAGGDKPTAPTEGTFRAQASGESFRAQASGAPTENDITILYVDEWLVAIDKPAGMLSVPGKEETDSVLTMLRQMYPDSTGPLLVHRLDMDTSGILIAAKTKQVHEQMQRLFETRKVKKRYTAILDGTVAEDEGEIRLPLSLDYYDRPRQKVDYENGKQAVTLYKVRDRPDGLTLIDFYPKTGRTHQLRVHAAHKDGLNCPILGDMLYGSARTRLLRADTRSAPTMVASNNLERMYLHASELEFIHPVTNETISIIKEPNYLKTFNQGR